MKNNKNLYENFTRIDRGGYLVVPRRLLHAALDTELPFTPAQAYLFLFLHCEFCNRTGKDGLKRGQMAYTYSELADRFCWSRSTVRNFLGTLKKMDVVKLEMVPGLKSKLTLCRYEALTGGHGRPVETVDKLEFFGFWKHYYELLGRDGTDYYAALSEWGRISRKEKKLAVENIERYFCSLPDIRFVKAAVNYLRFKAYVMPETEEEIG